MIFGIDPGLSGAVSVFDQDGQFVEVFDLPVMQTSGEQAFVKNAINSAALKLELNRRNEGNLGSVAYLETVAAIGGTGIASIFSLGCTFGAICAVLQCAEIPFLMIRPHIWKKTMGLNREKEASRGLAIRLVPNAAPFLERKKDHNRAEAILIGKYGMARHPVTKPIPWHDHSAI